MAVAVLTVLVYGHVKQAPQTAHIHKQIDSAPVQATLAAVDTPEQPQPTAQVAVPAPAPQPAPVPTPEPKPVPPPPAPKPITGSCADWMQQAGVTDMQNAQWLINKESGCRPHAINPSSGACGIAQALPCAKMPCTLSDPVCQIKWMQNYVSKRYGSWAAAVAFHKKNNWY